MATGWKIERRNPLPVGVYWVDVPGEAPSLMFPFNGVRGEFRKWVLDNAGALKVIREKRQQDIMWVLFEVLQPVEWVGPGLPTIGFHQMQFGDATAPPPPGATGIEIAEKTLEGIERAGQFIVTIGGAIGVLWVAKTIADTRAAFRRARGR